MTAFFRQRRSLILCLVALALTRHTFAQAPAASPLPQTLTVDQAVTFALSHNPSVTSAEQGVQIAQAQVRSAASGRLPTLGASANATYLPSVPSATFGGNTIALGQSFSASVGLSATQPVWPSTRWTAPIAGARANVGVNVETLVRTRQQVVFQTRQAFYQVLSAEQLLNVAQQSVNAAQTQLKLAQDTVAAGTAAPLDVYQAQAALSNAQVNQAVAQNGVNLTKAAFASQLGLPASTPIEIAKPEDTLPAVPTDLPTLQQTALRQRPELTQLNFRRQQLKATIDQIKLQSQPLVNATGNYTKALNGQSLLGMSGLNFGANIAFSLYNGGKTKADVDAAKTQLAQLDTSGKQLELGISLDVQQSYQGLQNSIDQLTAAQVGLKAATEALRIAEIRYQNGEGILLEVDQARVQQTQAQTAVAQAQFQAQVSAAQLAFALGEPAPAIAPAALVTPSAPTTPATAPATK